MQKGKEKKSKRSIRSFEIDAKTARLLKLAIDSTGKRQTEIINEALNKYLGHLVKHISEERTKAFKQFQQEWNDHNSRH